MAERPNRAEQDFRAEFMSLLISQRQGSVVDAMFMTDAIVRFITTGEILGHSPSPETESATALRKKPAVGVSRR